MKRFGLVVLTFIFSVFGANAFADTAKIGVVDLQKIMQTSSQIKEIQQKLEKEFKPRRDKLLAVEAKIKADMEKFKRDSAVLSASQKKEMERKIVSAQQQFERDGQQYQQELSTANNEAMESLYAKVRAAISKVAKDEKYDLIVQKDAAPFSSDTLDVTDKVAKAIN
ncbi:outer membrane protein OmpH [Legionella sainthelensi]|uniref:Outer membrane protein OmpH n=1 Tax=Legionella sainthelensi TaxID=28087 RepID=A0A0W0YEB7_9GAMM|nr:OmpH family outer membrane protein [Legionella sainthelensi]KTD54950.1 outer membrane protein OmpH [Legionella sainthelensi]VEH36322.1 outer membrane protein OmpH [Legionella sainthelensi]